MRGWSSHGQQGRPGARAPTGYAAAARRGRPAWDGPGLVGWPTCTSAEAAATGGSARVTRKPAASARMASASSRAETASGHAGVAARVGPAGRGQPGVLGQQQHPGRGSAWPTRRTSSVTAGPGIWVSTTSTSGWRWVRTAWPTRATTSRSFGREHHAEALDERVVVVRQDDPDRCRIAALPERPFRCWTALSVDPVRRLAAAARAAPRGYSPSRGAIHELPPASSRNRRTTNSSMPCSPSGASAAPRSATTTSTWPAAVGPDVDLDRAGPAVGGGVVDQVLDRLAQHGRAGLDLGLGGRLDAHVSPPGHGHGPGRRRTVAARSGAASAARTGATSTSPASCSRSATSARSRSSSVVRPALVAERGDRLAGDPHRRHLAPQLVSEHGGIRPRKLKPLK